MLMSTLLIENVLDLINLILFNKLNFMRLSNPLEYMTGFTRKLQTNSNIIISLFHYLLAFGGWLYIPFNLQKEAEHCFPFGLSTSDIRLSFKTSAYLSKKFLF